MSVPQKHGGIPDEKVGAVKPPEPVAHDGFEKFQQKDPRLVHAAAPNPKVSPNAGGNPSRSAGTKTPTDLASRRELSTAGS